MSETRRFQSSAARAALLEALLKEEGHEAAAAQRIGRRRTGQEPPPVSYAQQRLWFLDRLVPGNPFYNIDASIPIKAPVSVAVLHRSLNEIVRRHEALRTTFAEQVGQPVQVIAPTLSLPLPVTDLRSLPAGQREAEARRLAMEEARTPFDLARGPLIRTRLVTLEHDDHQLLLTMHHVIADGWSMGVLSRELRELYTAFAGGRSPRLPELPIQYADFAVWQREWLSGQVLETQLRYWRQRLEALPTLPLPTDRPRPAIPTFQGAFHPIAIPSALTERLRALGREEGCTLFMVLLAAFKVLLSRYSGQEDVVVGAPIANRNRAEIEPLIGFFVNTLVLRSDLSGDPPFREVLARVREVTLGAYAHQDLPFEKLVEELQPERDLSRNPLFQVIFQLFSTPAGHDAADASSAPMPEIQRGNSKFDLRFDLWETTDGLRGQMEYSTDLFAAESVERMTAHYLTLLQSILDQPGQRIGKLPLLDREERRRILLEWNDTASEYPAEMGVHQLFEAQAARTPDAIALDFADGTLSYTELERRSSRLAQRLRALGVGRETPVGILLERSAAMVVAMLGVLKAGGAYVPLDPSHPPARVRGMLEDVGAPVVITQPEFTGALAGLSVRTLYIADDAALPEVGPVEPPAAPAGGEQLAYVIFTSGSTGRPKGVMIPHRAITRLVTNADYLRITPGDTVAQASNASFDAATFEIWGALLNGARLVGISREVALSPPHLATALREKEVGILFLTTALFNQVVAEAPDAFAGLRCLLFGGEASDARAVRRLLSGRPPQQLLHVYGPTENTTFTTSLPVESVEEAAAQIAIGFPISNTRTFVLDRHLEPVPIGAPGELYIGGDGLARGYWESPDLDAEKFVPDPFATERTARLYRTGDLARYRADGSLEFLGRTDHQVKIRGFRVELPEIEAVLARHPAVRQSVVTLDRSSPGAPRIVAYVVADARRFVGADGAAPDGAVRTGERAALVEQWQSVFESVIYGGTEEQLAALGDATFNITGWNSSYTGRPIAAEEMYEQVQRTVERITALRPQRVLEIGCGTGLLLFRIAPGVSRYVATDFSAAALEYVRKIMDGAPSRFSGVELLERLADDFEGFAPGSFDTVILNSVAQYLPSIHDLLRVVDGALRVLAPGGTLFLGDLRSYPLLEAFHASVELFRAPDALTVRELRERIQADLQQEQELTVDPSFFSFLQDLYPQIGGVRAEQKRGVHRNELTRFRYDAYVQLGSRTAATSGGTWRDWTREGMSVAALRALLERERPDRLGFRHVPNARLRAEAAALRLLAAAEDDLTLAALREDLRATSGIGIEPEELWSLGETLPYEVCVRWPDTGGAESEMDVLFVRRDAGGEAAGGIHFAPARRAGAEATDLANDPLQGRFMRSLVPALKRHLQERLPEYMVPAAYVLLDSLPLTPNGKVDRAALPHPDRARPRIERAFVAPASHVEQQLAEIWAQVLDVEEVGVHDNFFTELGGHSLLATQVVSRVRDVFRVELPLRSLFESPTVAALAAAIATLRERPAAAVEAMVPVPRIVDDVDLEQLSDEEVDLLLRQMSGEDETHELRLDS